MKTTGIDRIAVSWAFARISGVSVIALAALTGSALASDRTSSASHGTRCAAVGEGLMSSEGIDKCLRIGSHVRVESRVMQGNASLGAHLPGFSEDGPAQAAVRDSGATRLRMQSGPIGGVYQR